MSTTAVVFTVLVLVGLGALLVAKFKAKKARKGKVGGDGSGKAPPGTFPNDMR